MKRKKGLIIFIIILAMGLIGLFANIYSNKDKIKEMAKKPITIMPQSQFNMQMDQLMMAVVRDVNLICGYDTHVLKTKIITNRFDEQQKINTARRDIDYFFSQINSMQLSDNQKEKTGRIIQALSKLKVDLSNYENAINKQVDVIPIYATMRSDLNELQGCYGVGEEIK